MSELAVSTRIREIYSSTYEGESTWRTLGAIDKVKNILDLCSPIPHGRILEIGSGEGAILKRLSDLKFGDELFSIEISESAVATIQSRAITGVRECRLFDGYHIPYDDRQFELAVLSHVVEHTEYPRMLLREAARVAKYVFVEVPLEDTIRLKPDFVFDSVGHINFYSWNTIRQLIQTCELRVLVQVTTNPSRAVYQFCSGGKGTLNYAIKEILLRASQKLATRLFTYHCSILCTRSSG
jgi:ubiquinone/menaquinone biosynthesis C-methylase UbiE